MYRMDEWQRRRLFFGSLLFFRVEAWLILDNHENVSTVVFFCSSLLFENGNVVFHILDFCGISLDKCECCQFFRKLN